LERAGHSSDYRLRWRRRGFYFPRSIIATMHRAFSSAASFASTRSTTSDCQRSSEESVSDLLNRRDSFVSVHSVAGVDCLPSTASGTVGARLTAFREVSDDDARADLLHALRRKRGAPFRTEA
jgi:hypothetical protein